MRTILDLRRMDRPCKKKGKKIDKLRTVARAARKVRSSMEDCGRELCLSPRVPQPQGARRHLMRPLLCHGADRACVI